MSDFKICFAESRPDLCNLHFYLEILVSVNSYLVAQIFIYMMFLLKDCNLGPDFA